jgi:hypothetical protein
MAEDNRRIAFLKDALNNLAAAVKEVSAGLIDLDGVIARITGKTRDFAKANNEATTSVNKTSKAVKESTASMKANESQTNKTTKANKGFFGNIGKNLKTIVSFYGAYQVLNLAISAFTELTVGSARRAIALEKSLADLKAVAGLTSDDIVRLKNVVFDVAGATSLTSTEVVELQKQLAKLGSSTEEIENLTRPIALLSQALGEDAGGVAATLKKTLNQFQATSEEADRFANILTGAVNETALSLDDLGTGLSYVGPLGAQLGVSFEETAALLGILADNGFKASKAGTGLRNFFSAAAKDGRPFNEFLDDVASKNLTAAENFEIFGKVAASQAQVLSSNVERYKELSKGLNESNRLFEANVAQMGSTQGQIQLLTSAYDKFSTALGEIVTKTNIFINLTKFLSPETAAQAKAFQLLSSASDGTKQNFEDLTEAMVDFGEGSEDSASKSQSALKELLVSTGTITKAQGDFLAQQYKKTGKTIQDFYEGTGGQVELAIKGFIAVSSERSDILRDELISQAAVNDEYKAAKSALSELQAVAANGNLTEEEREQILKRVKKSLEDTTKAYNDSSNADDRKVLEKRIALYEELVLAVNGLDNSQEALDKKEKARLKKLEELKKAAFKEELNDIQKSLEAEIDRINGIISVELEGAKNAEQAGEIRLKKEKLVQAAYSNSLRSLNNLNDVYPEFADNISDAADKYEKFTQFTQSAIGAEGINLLSDYKKEFEELGKQLKDNEITLGEYEAQEDALEASLISSITTLKNSTDANQELKDMLDKIVVSYLNAKKGAEDYIESTEDTTKKIKILGKTFAQDLSIEEAIGMSLATTADAISNFNDTALENTRARLDAEKEAITARYEVEQDILKSQLDNQLITESQYRQKQKELRKAQVAEENEIERKLFDAQKKRDRQDAATSYLQALASIIPNLIIYDKTGNPVELSLKAALSGALATAAYGAQLSAISQRKYVDKKFAEGGIVNGPSHAEGGVPFTVQGRGGYEMEGGEFIVNKEATARNYRLLKSINDSSRSTPTLGKLKFAQGGLVSSPLNESVDYLKAIAEATTSTAIGVSKPVRAYVADKDLRGNATERRIRDRNDRI